MMNEIDAVVQVLNDRMSSIINNFNSPQSQLGDIGEWFSKFGVKQCFYDKGYILFYKGYKTFRVYKQVNPNNKGRGGIDFNIDFTDSKGKIYECFTEVKNWNHYHKGITPSMYNSEIKDRFTKNDPNKNRYWILVMNKSNIPYIFHDCIKDKINIVPVDDQINNNYINTSLLKPTFLNFMRDFTNLINGILSGKVKK